MTSRTYYLPRNQIARHVLNRIVAKFECSIGVISRVDGDKLRVSITCRDCDVKYIENILRMYDMIGE